MTAARLVVEFTTYSGDTTETVALREVTTPIAPLVAGGTGQVLTFDDLADGTPFGSIAVQTSGVAIQIPLTPAAVSSIQGALGADLAIGLSLSSISGQSRQMLNGCCLIPVRMLEFEGDLQMEPLSPPNYFAPSFQVIDFEYGTTALPDNLPGVTFVSTPHIPGPWLAGSASWGGRIFGGQHFGNRYSGDHSDLGIEFDPPVQAVGAWIRNVPTYPDVARSVEHLRISAYLPSGALLEQRIVDLPAANAPPAFEGFFAADGIMRIEWSSDAAGFFGVDDVVYGDLAAPEVHALPHLARGALAAMLMCLGCRLVHRRRL